MNEATTYKDHKILNLVMCINVRSIFLKWIVGFPPIRWILAAEREFFFTMQKTIRARANVIIDSIVILISHVRPKISSPIPSEDTLAKNNPSI